MRDFITKIDNTAPADSGVLKAEEDNVRFLEMENAVFSAGINLDPFNGPDTSTEMMAQAAARYASGGIWYQDSGAANAYVCTTPLAFVLPKAYFTGMAVRFIPANDSTGVATMTANGVGAKPIFLFDGSSLSGGEILSGRMTELIYSPTVDSNNGGWLIAPWAIVPPTVSGGEVNTAANVGTGVGLFKTKSGTELRFRSITGVNGVSVSLVGDDVQVDGSGGLGSNLPFYPHVVDNSGTLSITDNGGGTIEIDSGQSFVMRGLTLINTTSYSSVQRQLSTLANKTYHVRFTIAGGFSLSDVTSVDDTLTTYDSTFDDMLIARVVTDGSNTPTITSLINKNNYGLMTEVSGLSVVNSESNGAYVDYTWDINFARRPEAWPSFYFVSNNRSGSPDYPDNDHALTMSTRNRHQVIVRALYDFASVIRPRINALMVGG